MVKNAIVALGLLAMFGGLLLTTAPASGDQFAEALGLSECKTNCMNIEYQCRKHCSGDIKCIDRCRKEQGDCNARCHQENLSRSSR